MPIMSSVMVVLLLLFLFFKSFLQVILFSFMLSHSHALNKNEVKMDGKYLLIRHG